MKIHINDYNSLDEAIRSEFGESVTVEGRSYIGGGDINDAACLMLTNGEQVFIKSNKISNKDFFDTEVSGLNAIAGTNTITTPKLICKGTDRERGTSFLMMELIRGGKKIKDYWEVFGRELAAMHLADTDDHVKSGKFGFAENNYIGAGRQINTCKESWVDFFRECRLEPQFKRAERYFDSAFRKNIIILMDNIDKILTEPEKPSLLHGDLWSGNFITGNDGKAWLIDPAVYVGHAEADIAMTELFGGFSGSFYSAYREVNPTEEGYKRRKNIYNLYHMLNHLNLFGSGYLSTVRSMVYNAIR